MVAGCKSVFAIGAVAAAVTLVGAAPIDYFPINSQLPPVARISQPFEFIFSPLTFSSPSNITYRLENAPKWLSIDSASRRLYGTPGDGDVPPGEVVGVPIELVAEDETGSTTANPTLVVSRNRPPTVAIPVSKQLPKFGTYIAPSSLHLHPSKPFSFSFDEHTFRTDSGDGGLNYYAVSEDNVPLPSWITLDAGTLSFSGETPPFESLVQPPQTFTFQLVASDVVGFASVSVSFSIVVGNHELTAEPPIIKLNVTREKLFEYKDLPDVLRLDEKPIKPEDITEIAALDLPPWLSFDNKSWALSGTPDSDADSSNITIVAVDKFSDTLNLTISIHFGLFLSDLPDLNLKSGDEFSFDLKKYLAKPADVEVKVERQSEAPWALFNPSSMFYSGSVPEHLELKSVMAPRVEFVATSKKTNETETKAMNIHIDSPSPTASPEPSDKPEEPAKDGPNKDLLWLLIIPILLVFLGIIALLFYVRRRRQQPRRIGVREVSGPVPGSFIANGPSKGPSHNVRGMVDIGPPDLSTGAIHGSRTSATASNRRSIGDSSSSSLGGGRIPHAMMAMYSRAKSPQHSVILERSSPSPNGTAGTDELSLLSDTSLGEGDAYIAEAQSYTIARRTREDGFRGLEVPMNSEPFSIQNTPDTAYLGGGRYDSSSDDAVPPPVGYTVRPKSGQQQQDSSLGFRNVGKRISNLWKRESRSQSPDKQKRNTIQSNSTDQTTRTSILTSGVSGGQEEEATTSMNVVARPTIIHIPSRPGEARQMSRRTGEPSPLFGGGSLAKSPRNFGLANRSPERTVQEMPQLPPNLEELADGHDSDTSWDRLARNSLGIAYKDLVTDPERLVPRQGTPVTVVQEDNWIAHNRPQDLLSPGQWPQSNNMSVNMVGIATTSPANTSSELPKLPPASALAKHQGEWKDKAAVRRRPSQASATTIVQGTTPSVKTWKHTRSMKSMKSVKSAKSTRSAWADDDDEDAWEDIRPPTTIDGWDDEGESDGSFAVYI
ncbi:hypothetical protein F5Y04DRAFT_76405 [Hypomontagnella monticulosa]|nr:hypothetical protein F5Y04DRAFT_76405 [Hypomontagnella monticulosa]